MNGRFPQRHRPASARHRSFRALRTAAFLAWFLSQQAARCGMVRAAEFTQWDTYGGDPTGAKYSSLKQINRSNVQVGPADGIEPATDGLQGGLRAEG